MAQAKDQVKFDISEGLDQDSFPSESFRGGWYNALNVLFYSGLQGKNKVASNSIGNIEIPNEDLLDLAWKPVWEKLDRETNYLYFLLKHEASSTYQIWRLIEDNVFELVLNNININSRGDGQIKAVNIVGGSLYFAGGNFGSFLYGTDGQPQYSNPKHFIIEKAIRYTASGGADPLGYPSIDFQTLSALKFPPVYSPTIEYATDTSFSQNFLYRETFQFAYRYIYDNKSKSLFSSYSQLAVILDNEFMDGKNTLALTQKNRLDLTINSGHHTVIAIEVAAQIGNTGIWGVFKTIDKAESGLANDTDFVVNFYGNESLLVVPAVDLFNYDLLPLVAGCQEYTSANTLAYSKITEGMNNPEQDVEAEWVHTQVPIPIFTYGDFLALNAPPDTVSGVNQVGDIWEGDSVGFEIFPVGVVTLPVGSTFVIKTQLLGDCTDIASGTTVAYYAYTIQEGDFTGATDVDKVNNMLLNAATYMQTAYSIDVLQFYLTLPVYGLQQGLAFRCRTVVGEPTVAVYVFKNKTFKQGCYHSVSIVYKKEGNQDGGVISDAFEIYLPYGNQTLPSGYTAYDFYQTLMRFKVNHLPPDWAISWVPVLRERSGMGAQMQRSIRGAGVLGQRVRIDFESYYTDAFQVGYNYTPEVGDSVRILQFADLTLQKPVWGIAAVNVQLSVLEFLPGGGTAGSDAILVEMFDISSTITAGTIIEVSKIKRVTEVQPYYEVGLEFPILDPHTPERRHGGGFAYSGSVFEAGDLGASAIKIEALFSVYENMAGRTIVLANALNETQTTTIDSVVDASPGVVTINTVDAFAFDFTLAAGGTWKILADQTDLMPAEVMLNGIDVYIRLKTMGINHPAAAIGTFVVEDDNASNYYPSQYYDKGRVHVYDKDNGQKDKPNFHRASLPIRQENDVNQLNKFIAGEEASGPFDRGAVVATYMRGETLRVFQEKKVYSIPINRQVGYLPSGGNQYLFSDANLGPQDDGSGISGPYSQEATIMIGTDIYYLDVLNKQFMKDTMGGPVPLNGRLNQFWIATCRAILENDGYTIRMGHSMATKELLITINGPFLSFTLSLSTLTDKWLTFYSFVPDMYLHGNERIFSVNPGTGILYEQNIGDPNEFFGTTHESILEFFTNINPEQDKRFLSLFAAINAEPVIEVYADATELQASGIYSTAFPVLRNDGYWADVNMNALTPGFSNQNIALAEGFPCQNPWFKVKITTPDGTAFVLRYVDLYFNLINEYK